MKKLILLLPIIICNFGSVFGNLNEDQSQQATELIQESYWQILGKKYFDVGKFCNTSKLLGLEEPFLLYGQKTDLKKQFNKLLKFCRSVQNLSGDVFNERGFNSGLCLNSSEHLPIEAMQVLLEKKILNELSIRLFFRSAVRNGREDIVNLMLPKVECIDFTDNLGRTPLVLAIANGCIEIVELLLANGANVNAYSLKGDATALMAAAINENAKIATLLLNT